MGKLYPVEQRHTEAAQRYFGYPLSPADAAHVIDAATHFARFEAEHLTRIEATPAFDREGVEAGIRIAIWNAARALGIGQDAAITLVQKAMEQPAIMALHPVKQSDGLAERVREQAAKVVEQHESDGFETLDDVRPFIASAIRSLDITRMDSDG